MSKTDKKKKRLTSKRVISFPRKAYSFSYFSIIAVWLIVVILVSSQNLFAITNTYFKKAIQKSNSYYLQNQFTYVSISHKSKLVLKTNIRLNSDIKGKGEIFLSSTNKISFTTNKNKISNLILERNTVVQLNGNLQIMGKLHLLDGSKIYLEDFNLIYSSPFKLEDKSRKNILETGFGILIEHKTLNNSIAINTDNVNSNQHNVSSDILIIKKSTKENYISYLTIERKNKLTKIYLDIDTPPPTESLY